MKRLVATGLLGLSLLLPLQSCGTLMFSERSGRDSGRLDPNVLILDGFGLLFFVLPGLVAFAVDYTTGALYLPEGVERGEGPFIE